MKTLKAFAAVSLIFLGVGCSNDASDGATHNSDSTINRVDTRRNTTTSDHTLYKDSVSDKHIRPNTGGTPTNPNTSGQ